MIDTVAYTKYVADIQSVRNVEVRARVTGYLESIHVDEGQRVEKGQLLFSITSQEYRDALVAADASLKNAIAEAKSAELNYQNTLVLVESNTVSKTNLEMARAKWDAMLAKIEECKAQKTTAALRLSYTEIKAPFAGTIDRIPYKVGSLIEEGTLVTKISDNKSMFAYFHTSEKEFLNADMHTMKTDSIELVLANGETHLHKGVLETVEGEFDRNTGTIAFRVRFANPENILRHGASGIIKLKRTLKDATIIPQKSTFEIQDRTYVYVRSEDGTAELRQISVKERLPHLFVVEGVKTSDTIVYEGIQTLREGSRFTQAFVDMRTISARMATLSQE